METHSDKWSKLSTHKKTFTLWVIIRALFGVAIGIAAVFYGITDTAHRYSVIACLCFFFWSYFSYFLTGLYAVGASRFYWKLWMIVEAIELIFHMAFVTALAVLFYKDGKTHNAHLSLIFEAILTAFYLFMWCVSYCTAK